MKRHMMFPDGFVWGAATSSYQIEGAWNVDGRSESIWDRFAQIPGAIEDGTSGAAGCDHYRRWEEDVELMRSLGIQAYRFSVAWTRILPNGRGAVNQRGLDFYRRLVDRLLEVGITPYVTLYHWDLPQVLEDAGGWPVREIAEAFVELTDVTTRALGDQVKNWITINEPWCASFLDYQVGRHAPGRKEWPAAIAASHHLLLAHGWSLPIIRQNSPGAEVGITLNFSPAVPESLSPADLDAARHNDGYFNRWFLEPLCGLGYPADMLADYERLGYLPQGLDFIHPGDMELIAAPTEFLGVNYYNRTLLRAEIPEEENLPPTTFLSPPETWADNGWEIHAPSFYDLLVRLHQTYHVPKLFITENGAAFNDGPDAEGRVNDLRRVDYLDQHLAMSHQAIRAGVPLAGYFVWSLLDNFEWERGYSQRFGVIWVDFETQERIPKESAYWYARAIAANGLTE